MLDNRIPGNVNITEEVLNQFTLAGHNIDGGHSFIKDASDSASFSAAVDACGPAGSQPCSLAITKNMAVGSNKTVETHITLIPRNGGKLTIETGVTVTMKGSMWAPPVQWIALQGTGVINFQNRFMSAVMPQWWGAKADGTTDDSAAIQAALDGAAGVVPVFLSSGNYLVDATLTIDNQTDHLKGQSKRTTILTRKGSASGNFINFSAPATEAILEDFTLDCDYEGQDGISITSPAWAGRLQNITILDCEVNALESTNMNNAIIINVTSNNAAGGTPDRQFLLGGRASVFGLIMISGVIPSESNLAISGLETDIYSCTMSGSLHLTKAFSFSGDNNRITGLRINTEDDSKTYTQLVFFNSGSAENSIRDVKVNKGASDTITNFVQDDELSLTTALNNSFEYSQADMLRGQPQVLANSATPSVNKGEVYLTGGTITITNFPDGYEGKKIMIIAEHSITITDGTNIFLDAGANWAMLATDVLNLIQKADGKWYETGRSDKNP